MVDSRKFQVNFQKAKEAADKYDVAAAQLENYSKQIYSLSLKMTQVLRDPWVIHACILLIEETKKIDRQAKLMRQQGEAARDCIKRYETAEAKLCGIAMEMFKESSKAKSRKSNLEVEKGKTNNKIKVDTGKNKQVKVGMPSIVPDYKNGKKKPAKRSEATRDTNPDTRSGWVEDFYYVDDQNRIWYYSKAYINRKGQVTAYKHKVGVSAKGFWNKVDKSFSDRAKDIKYKDPKVKVKDDPDHPIRVRRGNKWLTKEELQKKDRFSAKTGTVYEDNLIEAEGEVTVYGAEVEGEKSGKLLHRQGSASAKFLTTDFSAAAGVGSYVVKDKDGNQHQAFGVQAKAGGNAFLARAKASGSLSLFKKGALGVQGDIDVKVGGVAAEVGGCCQYIPGKGFEMAVKAEAGLYAVNVTASAGVTVLGIKADVTASLQFGIGGKFNIGFKDGKFQMEVGACVGLGGSLGISLDFNGLINMIKKLREDIKYAALGPRTADGKPVVIINPVFQR